MSTKAVYAVALWPCLAWLVVSLGWWWVFPYQGRFAWPGDGSFRMFCAEHCATPTAEAISSSMCPAPRNVRIRTRSRIPIIFLVLRGQMDHCSQRSREDTTGNHSLKSGLTQLPRIGILLGECPMG